MPKEMEVADKAEESANEMEVTDKAAESADEMDELVSVSLNKDGTINLQITAEQFSGAIRDALDAGGKADSLHFCLLHYLGDEQGDSTPDIEPLCSGVAKGGLRFSRINDTSNKDIEKLCPGLIRCMDYGLYRYLDKRDMLANRVLIDKYFTPAEVQEIGAILVMPGRRLK